MPTIRSAVPDDAATLATLGARTFAETFAEHNDPQDMARYLAIAYGEAIQRRELEDDNVRYLLLEEGGAPAGYAMLRLRSPSPAVADGAPLEIKRFYLAREYHGLGLADALMAACERVAREQGSATIWLAVWERNARAMRFYARHGFREVGSQPFLLGGDLQRDLVMARPVAGTQMPASTIPASRWGP